MTRSRPVLWLAALAAFVSIPLGAFAWQQSPRPKVGFQDTPMLPGGKWHVHDGERPFPPVVTPGTPSTPETPGKAPSDAVVLFDGKDFSHWQVNGKEPGWKIEDGAMVVPPSGTPNGGTITSKDEFGDAQIHVEFATPNPPKGSDQGRGNSGVLIMGRYEFQVLDSYNNPTYADGQASAVYGQYPPLVNASKPPGEWQVYDIVFTAPRFAQDGSLTSPAYITGFHNGVLVQNHVQVIGAMTYRAVGKYTPHGPKGPLAFQDHGNPVRYRNIWVREIKNVEDGPAVAIATPEQATPKVDAATINAGAFTVTYNPLRVISVPAQAAAAAAPAAPAAPAANPAQAQPVPKGDLTKYTFASSKIFPGTTRDYTIYVPKQYDPSKPACLYVNQDGVSYKAPVVFDELIAKGEMPVTIGVFVTPGSVRAEGSVGRTNRSFEYDGLGDAYARFLIDELLPEVETKTAPDGRAIKLSKDPNDRAIAGASSGAIAAFTVAWERPDSFRRVFSTIGTYVGLRGGNEYSTLIRKYEPRPLRVFLEDGSGDINSAGGDWWMANQTMERALKFAGYEVEHSWGTGGHNGNHATEIFPDAMRWLWKDYPKPIEAGKGSAELQQVLMANEDWQLVGEGYTFTEGPTANAKGEVFFSDIPNSKVWKVGLGGEVSPFINDSKKSNGLAFGPDGKLYACATGTEQVLVFDADGTNPKVLADGIRGNDLVVRHDGALFVTNPGVTGPDRSRVWFISPTGEKKIVDTGLAYTNGVALSPDQTIAYVTDMRTRWIYSYLARADGTLDFKQKYFHMHVPDTAEDSGADGIRVDRGGRLYVATRMGIQVCDREGKVNAIIPTPNGKSSNLCFGGPDFDVMYVTAGEKVYKRKVKTKGANAYEAPIKPPAARP